VVSVGVPDYFVEHGKPEELYRECGLMLKEFEVIDKCHMRCRKVAKKQYEEITPFDSK
jgi:deoxyxylulose-5-phosphate synthase